VLSKYVIFDDASLLKSTFSQHVKRMKTKDVSQRVEVNTTPSSLVGSVSVGILPDVTPDGDRAAMLDAEQVDLIALKETNLNPRN